MAKAVQVEVHNNSVTKLDYICDFVDSRLAARSNSDVAKKNLDAVVTLKH